MNTTTTRPPAAGEAAHTPSTIRFPLELVTGPTVHFAEAQILEADTGGGRRIVFSGSLEEATYFLRACNAYGSDQRKIKARVEALEEIQRTADAHPMIRLAHYVENWPKIRAAIALAKEA